MAPALVSSNGVAEVLTNPRSHDRSFSLRSIFITVRSLPHTTPPKRGPIRVTGSHDAPRLEDMVIHERTRFICFSSLDELEQFAVLAL